MNYIYGLPFQYPPQGADLFCAGIKDTTDFHGLKTQLERGSGRTMSTGPILLTYRLTRA